MTIDEILDLMAADMRLMDVLDVIHEAVDIDPEDVVECLEPWLRNSRDSVYNYLMLNGWILPEEED